MLGAWPRLSTLNPVWFTVPLATLGRVAQGLWNRVTRGHRPPVTGLDQRLLAERDTIRAVLGKNWRQAAVLTAGRLGFDYG